MPVFIAFAAFLLLAFGHRFGLPLRSWVVTGAPFGEKRKSPGQKSGVRTATLEMVLDHDSGREDYLRLIDACSLLCGATTLLTAAVMTVNDPRISTRCQICKPQGVRLAFM
jgi:hypothetical protein